MSSIKDLLETQELLKRLRENVAEDTNRAVDAILRLHDEIDHLKKEFRWYRERAKIPISISRDFTEEDREAKIVELLKETFEEEKYLVRADDFMVFERQECGRYQVLDLPEKNRPSPYDHFTYDNLVGHGFFPILEDELERYQNKHNQYYKSLSEECRKKNSGHGDEDDEVFTE